MIQSQLIGTLRTAFICTLLAVGIPVTFAQAAEHLAWNQAAFASAQDAGKSIIVEVTASWCPICAKQKPTIAAVESDPVRLRSSRPLIGSLSLASSLLRHSSGRVPAAA